MFSAHVCLDLDLDLAKVGCVVIWNIEMTEFNLMLQFIEELHRRPCMAMLNISIVSNLFAYPDRDIILDGKENFTVKFHTW